VSRRALVILDFGSQYSQLIARRVRELNVYCQLLPYDAPRAQIEALDPPGFILSGGPASVYAKDAPQLPPYVLQSGAPVLGICYGMQLLTRALGGRVDPSPQREYGPAQLKITNAESPLFARLALKSSAKDAASQRQTKGKGQRTKDKISVWMSHGDRVTQLAPGFEAIAVSDNSPYAAIAHPQRQLFGLQFHPEVAHTPQGKEILRAFLGDICRIPADWTTGNFIAESIELLRAQIGAGQVVCGLSGGVDSSVTAALLHRAVGNQLTCIFVNTGMLRQGEAEQVVETFQKQIPTRLIAVDATETFLSALQGVTNPETKRKIIGEKFIRIFEAEAKKLGQIDFLAQGTLYPDVIESAGTGKAAAKIKTHHNVGGLPKDIAFELVEPLRLLFKDEVRAVGTALGLPDEIIRRHPFPGPGLAVRLLGEITWERLEILRQADAIFMQQLWESGWYHKTSQAFAVLLPVQSVGVMGDRRTYGCVIALRAVTTEDFMTADWANLPADLLQRVSSQIVNEIPAVTRVVYDITGKPPATIEWE